MRLRAMTVSLGLAAALSACSSAPGDKPAPSVAPSQAASAQTASAQPTAVTVVPNSAECLLGTWALTSATAQADGRNWKRSGTVKVSHVGDGTTVVATVSFGPDGAYSEEVKGVLLTVADRTPQMAVRIDGSSRARYAASTSKITFSSVSGSFSFSFRYGGTEVHRATEKPDNTPQSFVCDETSFTASGPTFESRYRRTS